MEAVILLLACVGTPPDSGSAPLAFPYTYTPQADLEPYEEVRFETETWDPLTDMDQTALYVQKSILHRPGAPVEELDHYDEMRLKIPPLGEGVQVDFVGDVMWMGANWSHFMDPAAGMLDGDIRVGNLETPIDPDQPTDKDELPLYAFNAPPEILDGLPLDLVQLTNNHTMDMGNAGVTATIAQVDARGFARTGVDSHVTLPSAIGDIAFLAFSWGMNNRVDEPERDLFIVPFGHLDEEIDLSSVGAAIDAARANGAVSVVLLLHWGYEYEYYADPHFLVLAREMIALGADLVVGEGPHVVQPPEICSVDRGETPGIGTCAIDDGLGKPRTAAILYSLGDFGTTLETLPCKTGIVASVTLNPDVTGLGWQAETSASGSQGIEVVPTIDSTDPDVIEENARLDALLGTGWKR
jgi:hypothetical protein